MKEKVLVTGGAGFIGSHLVDKLIQLGKEVVVIDNLVTGKKDFVNPQARFFELDITSDGIKDIFDNEKFDYVYHLAAQIDVRKSVEDPVFDNQVNAIGSLNIFKNSVESNVKKVIFVSTGGALYGDVERAAIEDDPVILISPYAIHKYTAESYLNFYRKVHGLNYSVFRPANVYGPRQFKGGECGVVSIFTYNHAKNKKSKLFGSGQKTRDYVYVDDLVRAFITELRPGHSGIFNVGTGVETSNLEIIKVIEEITNKSFYYDQEDEKPGEVLRSFLSYNKLKKTHNWEPEINLREGIQKSLDWIEKNRYFV